MFPRDQVVSRGTPAKPPRCYDKLLDRNFPDRVDDVKFSRYTKAMLRQDDETERLAVREEVTKARISSLYRDWETDRKSTRLNSSHRSLSRMPSSA